jgi:FSR family fosmidomycin resistance protein-like MFS transporter
LVRWTAILTLIVYPAWLLAPWLWAQVLLLVAIRFTTLGWYQVLQGEAFASAPGRSGTVSALSSISGLLGGPLVWIVGLIANQAGLPAAMWLLLLGPLSLALFVREDRPEDPSLLTAQVKSLTGGE